MTIEALSCQELVELVTDYLEGALAPAERRRFEEHVDTCGGCARYVEQMEETIRIVGRLEPEAIALEAEAALLDAFRDWKAS